MPYNPIKEKRKKQNAGKVLSDEDIAPPDTPLYDDADIVGPEEPQEPEDTSYDPSVPDPRSDAEKWQGYILNAFDNAFFGYGDEVISGAMSILPGGKSWDEEYEDAKKKHNRYRKHEDDWSAGNIISGGAGFVGGAPIFNAIWKGVAKPIHAVMGGKAVTLPGKVIQTGAKLGATGAVGSEIQATGDAEGSITDRINAAIDQGYALPLMGAAAGVVGGAVVPGAARVGRAITNVFRSPTAKAGRYLGEKVYQSGKTVKEVGDEFASAAKTGKPVVLADTAPQGVRDAGAAAARMPGAGRDRAKKFLDDRQEGHVPRVSDDLGEASGAESGSYPRTIEGMMTKRAAEAKPLYDAAFNAKPLVSPKIVELTGRPSGHTAMGRGMQIAKNEGIPENQLVVRDASGKIIGYTTKALHYMKMGLDDMIESAKRNGDNAAARALTILKNELLKEMDRLNPLYAKAREVYAGHAANIEAVDAGRIAHTVHPDQIRMDMANMTPAQQEFFKLGFIQKLVEIVEQTPDKGNAVRKIFGNKGIRERIKAVVGPQRFKELEKKFGIENKMTETYQNVTSGSQTAERMAAQSDIDNFVQGVSPEVGKGFVQSLLSGDIGPLVRAAGMNGIGMLLRGIGQRTRAEIVDMLFSNDPAKVKWALQQIAKGYKAAKNFDAYMDQVAAGTAANTDVSVPATGATVTGAQVVTPYVNPF